LVDVRVVFEERAWFLDCVITRIVVATAKSFRPDPRRHPETDPNGL